MDRTIGTTAVTDIKGGFIVRMGAVAAQRSEEQLKDLIYLCANALNLVIVEDEDMKKLVMSIDPNNTVPIKTTTNNNIYTGNTVGTDDLMKLNKELKKNS